MIFLYWEKIKMLFRLVGVGARTFLFVSRLSIFNVERERERERKKKTYLSLPLFLSRKSVSFFINYRIRLIIRRKFK